VSWHQIYEKINYELKLRTTDGREWDENRIRRACRAEAMNQAALTAEASPAGGSHLHADRSSLIRSIPAGERCHGMRR
jgi:hypothetical protein